MAAFNFVPRLPKPLFFFFTVSCGKGVHLKSPAKACPLIHGVGHFGEGLSCLVLGMTRNTRVAKPPSKFLLILNRIFSKTVPEHTFCSERFCVHVDVAAHRCVNPRTR